MFLWIICFVIIQRLIEVTIAKRNEKRMLTQGGYEVGASHYPFMLTLHISFFISLLVEVWLSRSEPSPFFPILLGFFLVVQVLRIWCLASLKGFWNTKIIVLPGAHAIKKGPYRFFRHPNYLVVAIEILLLPLMFQAYITASLFTLLNFIMMSVRIPLEEKALMEVTNYTDQFKKNLS